MHRRFVPLSFLLILAVALAACDGDSPTSPGADFELPVGFAPAPQPDVPGVLDFGSVGDDGGAVAVFAPYQEEGFSLVSPDAPVGPPAFSSWGSSLPGYAGSAALWLTTPGTTVEMTRDDGGVFDVLSIEVTHQFRPPPVPGFPDATLTLTGTLSGGGTVTQALSVPADPFEFQTFALVGFEGLTKLSWEQGGLAGPPHQFDNIDFVIPAVSNDPQTKNECKKGGWKDFGFRNQGLCIRFVNTGKDSR